MKDPPLVPDMLEVGSEQIDSLEEEDLLLDESDDLVRGGASVTRQHEIRGDVC